MNVFIKKTNNQIKIYINDLLHLCIKIDEYIGVQSWIDDYSKYRYNINFHFKNNTDILCEYDDRNLWESILKQLDLAI
jgi:hypothetical protein